MTIKLKDIKTAPWNPRKNITEESVSTLAQTMKENGMSTPIVIGYVKSTKKSYLIAGHRRLVAAQSLGWDEIEYIKKEYDTEQDAVIATINDNSQREDTDPIADAEEIERLLEDGMTAKAIAAKTARSVSWVNRRKRLIGLCDAFKAVAGKFTADQLEKIASFEPDVQERVADGFDADTDDWERIKYALERESKDLASAKFDTAACHECLKRTGAQADLWGVCDGCLGQCQDLTCYDQKVKDALDAKIAELTKGAKEVVRVSGYWQMPSDSESSPKKCKQYPCAYVSVDYRGEIAVKWGESKKDRDEREKKEQERREAEREEERAASAREDGITEALDEWKDGTGGGDDCCVGLDDLIEKEVGTHLDDNCRAFVTWAVNEKIDTWHDALSWARVLRSFPAIAKLAGVSDEDVKYLLDNNEEENEDQ